MHRLTVCNHSLQLLPEKAIYVEQLKALLVSDVHLGKPETFQAVGVPIPTAVNQTTLDRLRQLCLQYELESVFVLGDLFHSKLALVATVLDPWFEFVASISADVRLIVGNHDRTLVPQLEQLSIHCIPDEIQLNQLLLTHEPILKPDCFTICGHIHPCVRIQSKLDNLRLPCFYLEQAQNRLVLPSFGEFTGGYDVELKSGTTAYAIAENQVIPLMGRDPQPRNGQRKRRSNDNG